MCILSLLTTVKQTHPRETKQKLKYKPNRGNDISSSTEGGRMHTSILHLSWYSLQGHQGLFLIPADTTT